MGNSIRYFLFIPQGDFVTLLHFIILSLATWRLSSLLVNEDGPNRLFNSFREQVSDWTGLLDCVWCVSIWIGIILVVIYFFYPVITFWIMLPFALSGAAIMVDKWVNG